MEELFCRDIYSPCANPFFQERHSDTWFIFLLHGSPDWGAGAEALGETHAGGHFAVKEGAWRLLVASLLSSAALCVGAAPSRLHQKLVNGPQWPFDYAHRDITATQGKVAQLCPTLCNPMDYRIHGSLQARILEWVAFPFSRGSSQPRDWTQVSCIAGRFFTSWATRDAYPFSSGSFLTQESNQGPLRCRRILYQLSYQGSPPLLKGFIKLFLSITYTIILVSCRCVTNYIKTENNDPFFFHDFYEPEM